MTNEYFNFDLEFKLGIEAVDVEHMRLVDMLNRVHAMLAEGRRDEAQAYFHQTLGAYVNEHFANEEKFMAGFGYPALEEHKKIHADFRRSFEELAPAIAALDRDAFEKALNDTYMWIIAHIGKVDKRYVTYYVSKK